MTNRERHLISKLQTCIDKLIGIAPSNPADIARLARFSFVAQQVDKRLWMGMEELRTGDLDDAEESLDWALAYISAPTQPSEMRHENEGTLRDPESIEQDDKRITAHQNTLEVTHE